VLKKLKPEINEGRKLSKSDLEFQPLTFYCDSVRKGVNTMILYTVPPFS